MASHSRSSSVAIHTLSHLLAMLFNSETTFFLSAETQYLGSKLLAISIHNSFAGRSEICQKEALT
jgi:hypothetical protein